MKKTGDRRLNKMAGRYASLAATNKERCRDQWHKDILQPYLEEIHRRADRLRRYGSATNHFTTATQIELLADKFENLEIFDVYRRADRLLNAAGNVVEKLVGVETRNLLAAECAKAVADIYDKRLYRVVKKRLYLGTP